MRLSLKTKIAYGFTGIADQCLFYLYGTFFMFFLTTVAGVTPVMAGLISAIGAVWDALMAPVCGYISDNTHSRFGKRRPYIILLAFPMAVVTSMLFTAIDADMTVKLIYYIGTTMLFWTLFPMFFIPFLAWGAELTADYNERTVLRSFAYVGNTVGLAIGTLMPTIIVDYLMNLGKSSQQAWQGAIMMVSACVFIALLCGPMFIKEKSTALSPEEAARRKAEKKSAMDILRLLIGMFKEFAEVLKLRSLRYIIFASILYLAASTIFASDRMYYFKYNMGISAGEITLLMAVVIFSGMVFVPAVVWSKKFLDKKRQFIIGMSICAAVMFIFRFIGVYSMTSAVLLMVAFGLGNMCYWQLLPAMIYDVCEVDELKFGVQRQGIIVSLQSLSESLSEAAGLLMLGVILEFAGFNEAAAVQPESALFWISNGFTIIPVIFMVLAIFMVVKYPITKKNFGEITEALERKRRGEEVNLEKFKHII